MKKLIEETTTDETDVPLFTADNSDEVEPSFNMSTEGLTINFADMVKNEPAPAGTYLARIEKATIQQKNKDSYQYFNLQIVITGEGVAFGKRVWAILSFHPNSLFRIQELYTSLGLDLNHSWKLVNDAKGKLITDKFLYETPIAVVLTVGDNQDKSGLQNIVKKILNADTANLTTAKATNFFDE